MIKGGKVYDQLTLGDGTVGVSAMYRSDIMAGGVGFSQLPDAAEIGSTVTKEEVSDLKFVIQITDVESAKTLRAIIDRVILRMESGKEGSVDVTV